MKKIISLLLITILVSSCSFGKRDADDAVIDDTTTVITTEVDTATDEVEVTTDDTTVITTEVDTATDEAEVTTDDTTMSEDDKLVEDAIKEIDKIISEIEADVK